MTVTASAPTPPIKQQALFGSEPLFAAAGLLIAMSLLVTVPAMVLDTRMFQGDSNWVKPIKFQIALSVYLLTLAFFARFLPHGMTERPTYRLFAAFVVFGSLAELIWIGGAAMFGIASHFNVGTPFMAAVYSLMGFFAVTLTSSSLVYAIAIWRNQALCIEPALKLSIVLGLALTFLLTVSVAAPLASMSGPLVGTPETGARVPVMGWSREVGDLRVAHFFSTHAMHFIPLIGVGANSLPRNRLANGIVWSASIGYVAFVGCTFWQALRGVPFLPL